MRPSRRAVLTFTLATAAGAIALVALRDYSASLEGRFGPLRPVLVTTGSLPAGRLIEPGVVDRVLETRRIPARFAPAGALVSPAEALGLAPRLPLAPGSYLTSELLAPPGSGSRDRASRWRGLVPVETLAHGVGALTAPGGRVDVLVSESPAGGTRPKTTVLFRAARVVDFAPSDTPGTDAGAGRATIGLPRREAIRLVGAEAAGSRITLIPIGVR